MRLLFVYNADSGRWNAALDTLHKVVSPRSYECRLCELTHGVAGVREAWIRALDELDVEVEFLHRDEFRARFQREDALPAVFEVDELSHHGLSVLLPAESLRETGSLDELVRKLTGVLEERDAAEGASVPGPDEPSRKGPSGGSPQSGAGP